MATFWCPRYPEYCIWNRDIEYRFKGGVLETDDIGAAFLRGQPMFGRLFLEHAPPPPQPERHPEAKAALEQGFGICELCEAEFDNPVSLKMHMIKVHHTHKDKEE
jgi:hypothetical protein